MKSKKDNLENEGRFAEYARRHNILWFAPKLVAELMQCSVEHIYDLVKSGKLCYIKDGKNIRFKPEDLDDYEEHIYVRRSNEFIQEGRQY